MIEDIAIQAARLSGSHKKLIEGAFWIPLNLLYDKMVKEKLIPGFRELPRETMLGYWVTVCEAGNHKEKWVKISQCFALYMYDLVTVKAIENGI